MQLVKSGFNSPASFNFLPCLLINESALEALGIPRFFHIQENSTQWLNSQGLEQAVSLSFEAASLWISLPQQQLQTLSSPWQLHLISSQGCWHRAGMSHYPLLACVPFPPGRALLQGFQPQALLCSTTWFILEAVLCQTRCWGPVTSQGRSSRAWHGLLSQGPESVTSRCPFSKDSGIISAQWCSQALPQTFRALRKRQ